MAFFYRYHRWRLSFPSKSLIYLLPPNVTNRSDCCYHREFNPKPSYFHHLAGGRVAAVHKEASPNDNEKRTAIHHQSLVPRGRLVRGSVPKMIRYIDTHPQKLPRSRDAKHIIPLTGDAESLARAHARVIPYWGVGVGVLSLEHVHCDTGKVKYHQKRQSILHVEHPRRALPQEKDS